MVISPQREEHSRAFKKEKKLDVPVLSDPGNQVADRYGIRYQVQEDLKKLYQKFGVELSKYNGEDSWTLPLPARLIIDTQGMIRHAEINPDHTIRPDPAETLAELIDILAENAMEDGEA